MQLRDSSQVAFPSARGCHFRGLSLIFFRVSSDRIRSINNEYERVPHPLNAAAARGYGLLSRIANAALSSDTFIKPVWRIQIPFRPWSTSNLTRSGLAYLAHPSLALT